MKEFVFYGFLSVMNLICIFNTENIVIIIINLIAFIMTFVVFIYNFFYNE